MSSWHLYLKDGRGSIYQTTKQFTVHPHTSIDCDLHCDSTVPICDIPSPDSCISSRIQVTWKKEKSFFHPTQLNNPRSGLQLPFMLYSHVWKRYWAFKITTRASKVTTGVYNNTDLSGVLHCWYYCPFATSQPEEIHWNCFSSCDCCYRSSDHSLLPGHLCLLHVLPSYNRTCHSIVEHPYGVSSARTTL